MHNPKRVLSIYLISIFIWTAKGFEVGTANRSVSQRKSALHLQRVPTSAPSQTSSNAAVTGTLETSRTESIKSRVGFVFGGLKNRIRRRSGVEVIEDISEFHQTLHNSREQFIAVFFHSPVCKACQAAAPHFYKLSSKYSSVKFLSVSLTKSNESSLKALGIKKFPFGHIYDSQRDLLDELPTLRKFLPDFEERLQSHVSTARLSESRALPLDFRIDE